MKPFGFILRLTLAGLIVLAGIAMFQDRLLYFPAKAAVADMVEDRKIASSGEFVGAARVLGACVARSSL